MRLTISGAVTRWRAFADQSALRRLGRDALIAATTSTLAKGLGFVKEILVAAFFGLSGALDIYLMSVVLIGFPVGIIVNAVQTAMIKTLAAEQTAPATSRGLFSATALLTLLSLAILLPIWLLSLREAMPWLASGFSLDKQNELLSAMVWLSPYYFLHLVNLLGYGVLQARGRFVVNGLLPSITPIAIATVLIASDPAGDWRYLTMALVAGTALECIALLFALHRFGQLAIPRWRNVVGVRTVVNASLLLLPGTLMLGVGPVVEQSIAASMTEGTNAALGYGVKLPAALQGIVQTAVGITVLPFFAEQLGQKRAAYCLHSLDKLTRWLLIGGGLLIIPLVVFSSEIVMLLFQRGEFDEVASARVVPIQTAYFVQLPFAVVAMAGLKALAALGREGLMSTCVAIAVILQSVLAYVLGLRFGAAGIAWAATMISVLLASTCYVLARAGFRRLSS